MALNLKAFSKIYLYRNHVDFRKSIDGLVAIVTLEMACSVEEGNLFVFVSRRRNKIKILYFDRTGYAVWYKRLERDKFQWPRKLMDPVVELSVERMNLFLSGVDVWKMQPHERISIPQTF